MKPYIGLSDLREVTGPSLPKFHKKEKRERPHPLSPRLPSDPGWADKAKKAWMGVRMGSRCPFRRSRMSPPRRPSKQLENNRAYFGSLSES